MAGYYVFTLACVVVAGYYVFTLACVGRDTANKDFFYDRTCSLKLFSNIP